MAKYTEHFNGRNVSVRHRKIAQMRRNAKSTKLFEQKTAGNMRGKVRVV